MYLRTITAAILIFAATTFTAYAQAQQNEETEDIETIDYRPKLFGAIKAKFETSLYDGYHRFNIRHSRLGVLGNAARNVKYQLQVDFYNEGKVTVLDAFVNFHIPSFEFILGQQQIGFSTDMERGPSNNMFINRSLLAKSLTTYSWYESDWSAQQSVGTMSARDLGFRMNYNIEQIPLRFSLGMFNGTGLNNPEWTNRVNLVGRVEYGAETGFGIAAAHYNGYTPAYEYLSVEDNYRDKKRSQRIIMWGGGLSYSQKQFRIEGEIANSKVKLHGEHNSLTAAHVFGHYRFDFKRSKGAKYIAPVARWDFAQHVDYISEYNSVQAYTAHRATLGANLGFAAKFFGAELRLQFEKFFVERKPADFSRNPLLQDKVSVEALIVF